MVLAILMALPLGIFLVQKQQVIKSRAAVGDGTGGTVTEAPVLPCPTSSRVLPGDIDGNSCIGNADYQKWLRDKNNNNVYINKFAATCDYKEWLKAYGLGSRRCSGE